MLLNIFINYLLNLYKYLLSILNNYSLNIHVHYYLFIKNKKNRKCSLSIIEQQRFEV